MNKSVITVGAGIVTIAAAVALPGCAASSKRAAYEPVQQIPGAQGVTRVLARSGPTYIAGQPDEAALRRFKDEGITAVVNLRTQREMDNREWVPFDEAALIEELGMEYVFLPQGGGKDDPPYAPWQVDAFAQAMERHNGKVLLHCQVGWRASHMWGAYLYEYRGVPAREAWAQVQATFQSSEPFEKLTGLRMEPVTQ